MDGHWWVRATLTIAGVATIFMVLADVFLTVLHARIDFNFVGHRMACLAWSCTRLLTRPLTLKRNIVLSFFGPFILVAVLITWFVGLMCGSALIVYPALGSSVRAMNGQTSKSFATALYVAGDGMTTLGASDYAPTTNTFRLLYPLNSLMGISVITLTFTYVLEIYNALQRRNTFALKLHLITAGTGDAAEGLASLGVSGKFETSYAHFAEVAAEMINFSESHHFYPALFYFRFRDEQYALPRIALITLDTVTLVKSALDDERYGWLKKSAAIDQVWRSSMHLLTVLAVAFLPQGLPRAPEPDEPTKAAWRNRYEAAVRRLAEAGIHTTKDTEAGAAIYLALRGHWDRYIRAFAEHMAHDYENIDRALTHNGSSDRSQSFDIRLHGAN